MMIQFMVLSQILRKKTGKQKVWLFFSKEHTLQMSFFEQKQRRSILKSVISVESMKRIGIWTLVSEPKYFSSIIKLIEDKYFGSLKIWLTVASFWTLGPTTPKYYINEMTCKQSNLISFTKPGRVTWTHSHLFLYLV